MRVFCIAVMLCLVQGCDRKIDTGSADVVFLGGTIYTVDSDSPWAEAVAVTNGLISYVGDERGVTDRIGADTEVIELGNGLLMPGFHDAHMHPMAAGTTYLRCPLNGLEWPEVVLERLRECAADLEDGEWLRATGLDAALLQGEGPGVALLDDVSGGNPAFISSGRAESAWLNTAALDAAEIGKDTPGPEGGEIVRFAETEIPTGVLRGTAIQLVWAKASQYSQQALRNGLQLAAQKANSLGITSSSEAAALSIHTNAYLATEQAGEMTLRVQAAMRWNPGDGFEQLDLIERIRAQSDGPYFRADTIKLFLDGGNLGEEASLLNPYPGQDDSPRAYSGDWLNDLVVRLDAAGFHIHMHAYGDRAVRDGLDAIESAVKTNAPWDRRHQLAHLALIHPDDLPRFEALGVTANIQPLWAWMSEERIEECELLGAERCDQLLRFRDLIDSGARVVAGSDWISASISPLYNIQVAVTRRPPDGEGPAWNPDQLVTLEEMLRAYTIDAAWQAGQETQTGSIEVGKAADLIILERNLFEVESMKIRDVKVLRTILGGRTVYQRH